MRPALTCHVCACCSHSYRVTVKRSDTIDGTYSIHSSWDQVELLISNATTANSEWDFIRKTANSDGTTTYALDLGSAVSTGVATPVTDDGFYTADIVTVYDDNTTEAAVSLPKTEIKSEFVKSGTEKPTLVNGTFPTGNPTLLGTIYAYPYSDAHIGTGEL